MRTAQAWGKTLTDAEGNSFQCDLENARDTKEFNYWFQQTN
jgi:hypothetical protein